MRGINGKWPTFFWFRGPLGEAQEVRNRTWLMTICLVTVLDVSTFTIDIVKCL